MIDPIVHAEAPITLVGGAEAAPSDLGAALELAPRCVAADSGAALALAAGVLPEAVIGDFDSIRPEDLARIPEARRHRVGEQISTDFEKALGRIAAPLVLGVGFLGGRLDHQLAVLHGLLALPHRRCLLVGAEEIVFLLPRRIELPTAEGDLVSFFPLVPSQASSAGLSWPLDGLVLAPGGRIGTSNRAEGPVTLETAAPGILAILPRRLMRPVAARLATPGGGAPWPAPAR